MTVFASLSNLQDTLIRYTHPVRWMSFACGHSSAQLSARMLSLYVHVLYNYIHNSPRTAAFCFSGSGTDCGESQFTPKAPSPQFPAPVSPMLLSKPLSAIRPTAPQPSAPFESVCFPPINQAELHSHFTQPDPSWGFAALAGSTLPFASFNKSQSPSKNSRSIRSTNFEEELHRCCEEPIVGAIYIMYSRQLLWGILISYHKWNEMNFISFTANISFLISNAISFLHSVYFIFSKFYFIHSRHLFHSPTEFVSFTCGMYLILPRHLFHW